MALAQGLNTGAIGQAALSQNNQLQSNLNTLGAAQAQNLANIEQQRALLGQQYQLQILQAQADNDFERAQALYNEAVRQDEILREQQAQQTAFMQELMLKSMGSSSGGSRSSGVGIGTGTGTTNYVLDDLFKAAYQSGGGLADLSSKTFRNQFGFGDYNADDLQKRYETWLGTLGGSGLGNYREITNSSPTMSTEDKNNLAWSYYQNGTINYDQLNQILNELGTGA
jgi:hypothetical protein